MRGSLKQRYRGSWSLILDLGYEPDAGGILRRHQKWVNFRGTRKDAEDRPKPVFPSSFTLLAPGSPGGVVGVAVRCPHCENRSINLVSQAHIDLPFHNDAEVGVVEHVFEADAERAVDEFRLELYSGAFDTRRLAL